MSFLNGDTSVISGALSADNTNTAVNETDRYNLWENANVTMNNADEKNSTAGSKIMMGMGFTGAIVASVLLGGKVFGEIENGKKVNPSEVKWALGIVIFACAALIVVGFVSQMKDVSRNNQLADDVNKTALENQKSLQQQAKDMQKRHRESTDADTKLYKKRSELIGKVLTNYVANGTDELMANSKRRTIGLVKEVNQIKDEGGLSENIRNLETVNSMKSKIEEAGFIQA